jgi:phage protein D
MNEQFAPIYRDYDFYVPAFEVELEGEALRHDILRDVISVSYSDSLESLDSCTITLNNWNAERRVFKYSDPSTTPVRFDPGAGIKLWIGYADRGGLTLMLRGQITSVEPDFPAGGQPTIQVRALNQLHKLNVKQETRIFPETADDVQIARLVLEKVQEDQNQQRSAKGQPPLNLELVPPAQGPQVAQRPGYVIQNGEYPMVFLMQRARYNGYDIYIEEIESDGRTVSRLHFHPPDRRQPVAYELAWGRTLISFKPKLSTAKQVSKVTVRGWNPLQAKQPIVGTATWNDLDLRGLPNDDDMESVNTALAGSEQVITDESVHSQDEANQKARDHLRRAAKSLVSGSGSTVGLPELRAGRPVSITGLGSRFSGRYLITSSNHQIGESGYTTSFEARMEELK